MAGRKPKPTAVKKLEGNPGRGMRYGIVDVLAHFFFPGSSIFLGSPFIMLCSLFLSG